MKFSKILTAAAAALAFSGAQAGIVIDDFSIDQAFVADTTSSNAAGSGVWATQVGPSTSIIGGYRDIYVQKTSGGTSANVSAVVENGFLSYNEASSTGFGIIRWDGINSGSSVDVDGLGGVNMAVDGVAIRVKADADQNFPITLSVWHDADNNNTFELATMTLNAATGTGIYNFDFSSFAAGVFSKVGAIELKLSGGSGSKLDIDIDIIQSVPEPTTLALVGLALVGAGVARRRMKA